MTQDEHAGAEEDDIPALFATIHFRSDDRPDGYTDDEIAELTERANSSRNPAAENAG